MERYVNVHRIKIGVIVPIYNTEKYLKRCLDSILGQTYTNLEIILIDDGSTDNSLQICKEYQNCDSRIHVYMQKNNGQSAARAKGILLSNADLVTFVDSDDWIELDMYENMVTLYEETHADLISTGIFNDYESGTTKTNLDHYNEGFYDDLEKDIYPSMLRDNRFGEYGLFGNLCTKLFKRSLLLDVYENINLDVFYGEDCLAFYSYCMKMKSIYVKRKAYYHYNIHSGSMCTKVDSRLPNNALLLYLELRKLFMQCKDYYPLLKQLKRYMLDIECHNLHMIYGIGNEMLEKWSFDYDDYYDFHVVIYGAGECGQALYQQIARKGKTKNIVAWVDKYASQEKSEKCFFTIEPIEKLNMLEFEYILIAVKDERLSVSINSDLKFRFNIPDEKIIWKPIQTECLFSEIL